MNLIEEQERREEINEVLARYSVPTKHADLQRANELDTVRHIPIVVAIKSGDAGLSYSNACQQDHLRSTQDQPIHEVRP